jgi:hypothetical protein
VIGFTRLGGRAGHRVTVNAIAPGYIGTDMVMAIKEEVRNAIIDTVPVKRLGKPEEIGAAVVFLARAGLRHRRHPERERRSVLPVRHCNKCHEAPPHGGAFFAHRSIIHRRTIAEKTEWPIRFA